MKTTSFLETAWSLVEEPEALLKHYRAETKNDATLELALTRYLVDDADQRAEAWRSLEASKELLAPLATSELFGERAVYSAYELTTFGNERTAAVVREMLPKVVGPELRAALVTVLAHLGTEADFPQLHALLDDESTDAVIELARRGDSVGRTRLLARCQAFFDEWSAGETRYSSSDWDEPFRLVTALGKTDHPEVVPLLINFLQTPCVIHALEGLERIKDKRALEPVRALLNETAGERPRTLPYLLGAQAVLHALGEKQGIVEANAVFETAFPKRYGWPKLEHVYSLRAQALRALRTRGGREGLERAARCATASDSEVRAEGLAAAEALGKPVTPEYLDVPYVEWLAKRDGINAVKKRLDSPNAVFSYNAALVLSKSKDASAKKAARDWALNVVEGQLNYDIDEMYGAEPEISTAIEILQGFKKDPAVVKSKSAWLQKELFEVEPPEVVPPAVSGSLRATISRVDQSPFVFGAKINAIAVDRPAKRLAAVMGDAPGSIVDASTGAVLVHLNGKYRWAFDCAFSPDGTVLAVAYHGGHLVLFDAATGQEVHEFDGFRGVPSAVKKLAFSPDGKLIAAGGSDGSARLFDMKSKKELWSVQRKGCFEAVAFSPDGAMCLFSHVSSGGGSDELHSLDVKKKKATVTRMPSSMWTIAFDGAGRIFLGGEGKEVLALDMKLKPVRGLKFKQAQVVRLAWAAPGVLAAVSQSGDAALWDVEKKKKVSTLELPEKAALWALATSSSTVFVAGDRGVVSRFDSKGAPVGVSSGVTHTDQLRGFITLRDGTLITGGWDGRLIRWAPGAREGELLYKHGSRLNAVASSTNGKRVYCAADAQVVIHDLVSGKQTVVKVQSERVEDINVRDGAVALAMGGGQVHLFDETATGLKLRWSVPKATREAVSVAITEKGTVLFGTGKGGIAEIEKGEIGWKKREHGLDLIDKDPLGSPHRDVVGLDVSKGRFASFSNDDTLRVFDVKTKRRVLRAFMDGGLFNNCAFSPDGKWVVGSCSSGLTVFDVESGKTLCELTSSAFPGSTSRTIVEFSGPREVLLGTENGHIYRIAFA